MKSRTDTGFVFRTTSAEPFTVTHVAPPHSATDSTQKTKPIQAEQLSQDKLDLVAAKLEELAQALERLDEEQRRARVDAWFEDIKGASSLRQRLLGGRG